jgi:CarD family transcriptional regulator
VLALVCERGSHLMIFKVGDTVVYPHHGAALIEAIETRTIKGEAKEYLVLKVAQGDLTVRVPAETAEYVSVRDVVGQEGLDKVFQVLRAPHTEEPTNWSRRYKANLEKLASGDVNKVAEVVRDLWRRDQERGLSAGEKPAKSSSANWHWRRTPMTPRRRSSSTRFWPRRLDCRWGPRSPSAGSRPQ